ncbi:hypothetical protein BGX38DRAFT_1145105 [Terfezia claveryi]|nr:hypothetical protein BGX38DRAFT_1145105 [Terfezia claveryi]
MCMISINHHPSCKCTYYILEHDCGASSSSHPSCVQFKSFPVSRWSNKTSYIRKLSGDCGACSGAGDSSDVLARINVMASRPSTAEVGHSSRITTSLARWRPDTGLSVHTEGSMDSVSSQTSVNSNFQMDGLSRSVSMGIQTFNDHERKSAEVSGSRPAGSKSTRKATHASPFQDRFTRPEMEWRRTELADLDHTESVSCWIS